MTEHNTTILSDNLFFKEKPSRILLHFRENQPCYGREISTAAETTYAHTIKLLKSFRSNDLIKEVDSDSARTKYYELTEEGEDAAKAVKNFVDALEGE